MHEILILKTLARVLRVESSEEVQKDVEAVPLSFLGCTKVDTAPAGSLCS